MSRKGQIPWNKGLTKETDERLKKYADSLRNYYEENKRIPWNKGLTGVQESWNKGLTKETDERLKKLSEDRMGENNPNFGKNMTLEAKEAKSKHMKYLIETGQFTPNIHNSKTHWQVEFNGKKYRSSWEAAFILLNPLVQYEKLRIKYINNKGIERIYIVDFIDIVNNKVYEIKPTSNRIDENSKLKEIALLKWCYENSYELIKINEMYIFNNWDKINNQFDEKTNEKLQKTYNGILKLNEANKQKRN